MQRTSPTSPGPTVDVVVVGGGVTGAGVALDAASRGLSVVLLERTDLAAGTSRWSSKLVHGGLRYLAHGEIGLARESARERAVLMGSTAPHLVRKLPFLVPDVAGRDVTVLAAAGGHRARRRPALGPRRARLAAVDPAGDRGRGGPAGARACGRAAGESCSGTGSWWTTPGWWSALARTAASYGARILTGAAVTAVDGYDVHAIVDNSEAVTLRAGVVVNAAGVWAQRLAPGIRLLPSRGSHLVVRGIGSARRPPR